MLDIDVDIGLARDFFFLEHHGRVIALHVPSMSVLELQQPAVEYLQRRAAGYPEQITRGFLPRQSCSPGRIALAIHELQKLCAQGHFEPVETVRRPEPGEFPEMFWLHVAHACDMRCVYCFADQGAYGGPAEVMSVRTARHAVDWILGHVRPGAMCHVLFFGGEPLLNLKTIKETVAYARSQNEQFSFGLITNGARLTKEICDYLIDNNFHLTVSLDGPPPIQGRLRPMRRGTYPTTQVETRIRDLITRSQNPVSVRATITRENLNLRELFDYFYDLGFRFMSFMPALGSTGDPWRLDGDAWDRYLRELTQIANEAIARANVTDIVHLRPLDNYLERIHFRIPAGDCGAAEDALGISPAGRVYPCARFVGEPAFCCGEVPRPWDAISVACFREKSTLACAHCQNCWARYYCEGGCPYYNVKERGDICKSSEEFCARHRQLTELSLGVYSDLCRRPEVLQRYF